MYDCQITAEALDLIYAMYNEPDDVLRALARVTLQERAPEFIENLAGVRVFRADGGLLRP
jgi:hypothetical protein